MLEHGLVLAVIVNIAIRVVKAVVTTTPYGGSYGSGYYNDGGYYDGNRSNGSRRFQY